MRFLVLVAVSKYSGSSHAHEADSERCFERFLKTGDSQLTEIHLLSLDEEK